MKKTRIIIFSLIFIFLLAFLVWNSNGETTDNATETVRLNEVVRSIFYAPQYVAINEGLFEEEGLNIDLQTGWGGDKSMTALVSGTADIGLIGSETSIYVVKQDSKEKIINFAQLTQTDGSFLVSRKDIPDFKFSDLNGKEIIGGRRGGIPQIVMEYTFNKNGINPKKDIDMIQNIAFEATTGAFQGGTGDFIQLFEPNASKLEKEKTGHVVASFGTEAGNLAYTVFMATESYLGNNPETVQKFTNAVYKGQIWCENHTSEEIAQSIKSFFPEEDLDIIIKAVDRYKEQKSWSPNPLVQKESIERLQDVMIKGGELDTPVPYKQIVNNNFSQKAIQDIDLP